MEYTIFEKLKKDSRLIDDGIKRLDKIWETPQNLLCHRGENIEEAQLKFEDIIRPIKKIRDELIEDMGPRAKYLKDMDRFLEECATACDELKQGVDDIETLFSEYGYENPDIYYQNHNHDDDNENSKNSFNNSILKPEEMENLTINSSLSNQSNNVSPIPFSNFNNGNNDNNPPKYIATPVIKSVASVMQAEQSANHNVSMTINRYPQEPIYSPYYYKKK